MKKVHDIIGLMDQDIKYKRYLKNYLINRKFQLKFFLRIFILVFTVFLLGSTLQAFLSQMAIKKQISKLDDLILNRDTRITSINDNQNLKLDQKAQKHSRRLEALQIMATQKKKEINEIAGEMLSAFIASITGIGLILNLLISFIYGILLSHKFAGNHYRLKKFAIQLQEGDFRTPLVVRKSDFFQETAIEFEKARKALEEKN